MNAQDQHSTSHTVANAPTATVSDQSQHSAWTDILTLDKLKKQHRQFVRDVKECETAYFDCGMKYFSFPRDPVLELVTVNDHATCLEAFDVDEHKDPDIIIFLHEMRQLRDEIDVKIRIYWIEGCSIELQVNV